MQGGKRSFALVVVSGLLLILSLPSYAGHNEDDHSANFRFRARKPIRIDKDVFAAGSDLAFRGRMLVAGAYEGIGLFRTTKKKPYLKQIGFHTCPGSQGDVAILGRYVFVSIDSPSSNNGTGPLCNNTDDSQGKEGIRIVDISNPKQIRQVRFVETKCGSHTHTLMPGRETSYLYISSYPISQSGSCNAIQGHGAVGIVEFPTADPTEAKVIEPLDVTPTPAPNDSPIGCHDITVYPDRDIAVAACISESQVWNIKDPAKPEVIARIENPAINIHHSSAISWDGKFALIGDEMAGATTYASQGCTGNDQSTPGALWFYDITDPSNPQLKGHHALPRVPPAAEEQDEASYVTCTTHNFNVIPMKDRKKYLAVVAYFNGGIAVVDFSNPEDPEEVGYYLHLPKGKNPDTWSAYWYNGRIYTNDHDSLLGVGVYFFKGTGKKKARFFKGEMNPQTQSSNFR